MGGGDLLNLLIERDVFDEDFTRFYIAEVCYVSPLMDRISLNLIHRWFWLLRAVISTDSFIGISSQMYAAFHLLIEQY